MLTTLAEIRREGPCIEGWLKLLRGLGKSKEDTEPLELSKVLTINGLDDAVWALRVAGTQVERVIGMLMLRELHLNAEELADLNAVEAYVFKLTGTIPSFERESRVTECLTWLLSPWGGMAFSVLARVQEYSLKPELDAKLRYLYRAVCQGLILQTSNMSLYKESEEVYQIEWEPEGGAKSSTSGSGLLRVNLQITMVCLSCLVRPLCCCAVQA